MNYAYPAPHSTQGFSLAAEQNRQRIKAAVISFTKGTSFFAEPQDQQLLELYMRGRLTIEEVVYFLEAKETSGGSIK